MSLAQIAAASRVLWPSGTLGTSAGQLPTAVVMTAIAGAESGYRLDAAGDSQAELQAAGASPSTIESVAQMGCGGYGSWGPWQVFLPYHLAMIQTLSGNPNMSPCQAAAWLAGASGYNAARAANEILYESGPGAWSTYTGGEWQAHIAEAQAAVGAAPGSPQWPAIAAALAAIAAAAAIVAQ